MDIKFLENSIGRMVVYLKSSVYKNMLKNWISVIYF